MFGDYFMYAAVALARAADWAGRHPIAARRIRRTVAAVALGAALGACATAGIFIST